MLHLAPSTIRSWARKHWIHRIGTGPNGRALYDPAELLNFAALRLAERPHLR